MPFNLTRVKRAARAARAPVESRRKLRRTGLFAGREARRFGVPRPMAVAMRVAVAGH